MIRPNKPSLSEEDAEDLRDLREAKAEAHGQPTLTLQQVLNLFHIEEAL